MENYVKKNWICVFLGTSKDDFGLSQGILVAVFYYAGRAAWVKGGSTRQEWQTLNHSDFKFCFPEFSYLGHIQEAFKYAVGLKEV